MKLLVEGGERTARQWRNRLLKLKKRGDKVTLFVGGEVFRAVIYNIKVDPSRNASQTFDADRAAQQALGWTLAARYDRAPGELALTFRDREGRPFTFYHYMLDLTCGPCIYKRVAGCGSGTEYLAVTPWGDLYPCHQFVGDSKYLMGNLDTGVTNYAMREKFASCNAYSRPECRDCWAKLYCSGGCAANSYHATSDINGVYEYGCELFKKRIECAIAVKLKTSGLSGKLDRP